MALLLPAGLSLDEGCRIIKIFIFKGNSATASPFESLMESRLLLMDYAVLSHWVTKAIAQDVKVME